MASTFSPRSRGDREFIKFGLDGNAGDTTPVGISVGGYTSTNIFKNVKVDESGNVQVDVVSGTITASSRELSSVVDSVKIVDGGGSITVDGTVSTTPGDLSSAKDSVRIVDGGGSITVDGSVTTTPVALSSVVDSVRIVDGEGSITVDGTFYQSTQPVSATALDIRQLSSVIDSIRITDGGGSITVDGTFWQTTQPISFRDFSSVIDSIRIADGGGSVTIDGSVGITTADLDIRELTSTQDSIRISGDIAHDAVDSGNPIKVGGISYNFDGSVPGTAVTEADRANFITDVYGRQFVEISHPNYWSASENYTSAESIGNTLVANPGAGLKLFLTDLIISNGATAGTISIIEGLNVGSTTQKAGKLILAINGGAVVNFKTPIALTVDYSLGVLSEGVTTHSATVSGFTSS